MANKIFPFLSSESPSGDRTHNDPNRAGDCRPERTGHRTDTLIVTDNSDVVAVVRQHLCDERNIAVLLLFAEHRLCLLNGTFINCCRRSEIGLLAEPLKCGSRWLGCDLTADPIKDDDFAIEDFQDVKRVNRTECDECCRVEIDPHSSRAASASAARSSGVSCVVRFRSLATTSQSARLNPAIRAA